MTGHPITCQYRERCYGGGSIREEYGCDPEPEVAKKGLPVAFWIVIGAMLLIAGAICVCALLEGEPPDDAYAGIQRAHSESRRSRDVATAISGPQAEMRTLARQRSSRGAVQQRPATSPPRASPATQAVEPVRRAAGLD